MGLERTIHLNVTEHPPGITPSRAGHSIGRWENDVLVVDTVGFEPGILSADGRLPHSDRLHVIERFSLDASGRSLRREWMAEDERYFAGQYTGSDVVHLSDVPYQETPCEDLSYKSSGGDTRDTGRVMLVGVASLIGAVLVGWALMRRLVPRTG